MRFFPQKMGGGGYILDLGTLLKGVANACIHTIFDRSTWSGKHRGGDFVSTVSNTVDGIGIADVMAGDRRLERSWLMTQGAK